VIDEGNDAVGQTLFKHYKPADTTVAILEWMDGFKAHMEGNDGHLRFCFE